jgi:peptidoglycan hydrolase CwlO-like protein
MHIEIKELIIRKHLNGMALRDIADHLKIAKNIEISKDTVNNIINEWRSGRISYHPDIVSDEEYTIDLSKYIKRNNLSSNEIGEAAIEIKQIMAMGHTREQIFFIFKALKNMTPENAKSLIDTVNRMDKNGINYTNLDAEINDLQIKEDNLEKKVNENQLTITEQQKSIQEYGKKIEDLKGNIKKEEKRLKDIKRNVYMQKKKLDLSREINSSLEKLHIDKAKLMPFLKDSCKFGYSSESFKNANEVWDSLPSNVNKPKAIIEVLDTLKIIKAIKWDFNSTMELAKLLHNISGSKDEVIKIVSDIDNELKKVKNDILQKRNINSELEKRNKQLSQQVLEIGKQVEELKKKKSDLDNVIDAKMARSSDLSIDSTKLRMEMEKMRNYVEAGKSIQYFLRYKGKYNVDSSFFTQPRNMISNEKQYKYSLQCLLDLISTEFKGEFAIVEYKSRNTMKIVDGDGYERAMVSIINGDVIDILHSETVRIQNMYGNNIGALLTDVLEGKKSVKSISHLLKKIVDSTIKNAVEKKLSEVIDSIQDNRMIPKFPVLTEVNGKLDVALVSYSAISKSVINHMDTVKGDVGNGEENVIVRMCDAVKFLALTSMDSRVDEDLRTQFRESLDKAKREHGDEIVSNRLAPIQRPVYTIKLGSRNESNAGTLV